MKKIFKSLFIILLAFVLSFVAVLGYNVVFNDIDPVTFVAENYRQIVDHDSYDSIEEAGSYLRKQMVERKENVEVTYYSKTLTEQSELAKKIYNEALIHTGVSNEGDYLHYSLSQANISGNRARKLSGYYFHFKYAFKYRSTLEEENVVSERVKSIVSLAKGSDYDKIKYFNDYIAGHVTYDEAGSGKEYTAYGALVNQKAVCQGYTLLMYRLLLEAHIDNRMITGKSIQYSGTDNHTWNIVKLGDIYYDLDVTWNDSTPSNLYFLKGDTEFSRTHRKDSAFTGVSFKKQYPLSLKDY